MSNPYPLPSPATQFAETYQPADPLDKVPPLGQVKRMQRLIFKRATTDEKIDNRELAQLALAWERLEERKRVMCGKPAPKPVDVAPRESKRKVVSTDSFTFAPPAASTTPGSPATSGPPDAPAASGTAA